MYKKFIGNDVRTGTYEGQERSRVGQRELLNCGIEAQVTGFRVALLNWSHVFASIKSSL